MDIDVHTGECHVSTKAPRQGSGVHLQAKEHRRSPGDPQKLGQT